MPERDDGEKYSIDEECVISNHVDNYMIEQWSDWRTDFLHLIANVPKGDWDMYTKFCYKLLVLSFTKWCRTHPMPTFSKFEAHDPNAHNKKVVTK